jgi:hypothetical protein
MVVAIFHVLKDLTPYRELGAEHVPTDQPERRAEKLVHLLQTLGFKAGRTPAGFSGDREKKLDPRSE